MWAQRARWAVAALAVVAAAGVGPGSVDSAPADVVIVGDSLTAANLALIRARLDDGGLTSVRYAALSGRKIADPVYFLGRRSSGIEEVRVLQAAGVDPELWVVELGTNDLAAVRTCGCPDPSLAAGDLIDLMVAEIGPGEPIAWVTLLDTTDLVTSEHFNAALRRRAAVDPLFSLIHWYSRAWDRPELFVDHVHHNLAGVDVFAEMYLQSIVPILAGLGAPPTAGSPPADRVRHDGFSRADIAR